MKNRKAVFNYYRSTLKLWWKIMSGLIFVWGLLGNMRTEVFSAVDQEKWKLAILFPHIPWHWLVIGWLILTLVAVLHGAWKSHQALTLELEAEREKAEYPDISIDAKEILRIRDSSLFIHLTLFNSTEAPTLIENYHAVITIDNTDFEGEVTDDVPTYVVADRIEDINAEEKLDWREIQKQPLTCIKTQITPSAQLKKGTHFTGWLRFYFGYAPDWPLDATMPFSLTLKDSYGRTYSFELECPPFDLSRIVRREKNWHVA